MEMHLNGIGLRETSAMLEGLSESAKAGALRTIATFPSPPTTQESILA
jgi:hypothetical protein